MKLTCLFISSTWQPLIDACTVKNGGCDPNALCSHDPKTNAVQCHCKTGYVDTDVGSAVVCTGSVSS